MESLEIPSRSCGGNILYSCEFGGDIAQAIIDWKYRRRTSLTAPFAESMVSMLVASGRGADIGVVTWAPTSVRRRRERGYDQSELLARAVARRLRRPCRCLLVRDTSEPQTGRSRRDRMECGPHFRARPNRRVTSVLLVDDVTTTGVTLRRAEHALHSAGYIEVVPVALAHVPHGDDHTRVRSRTRAMAAVGSTSTTMPCIPRAVAASTFAGESSRNAVRAGSAPRRSRATR